MIELAVHDLLPKYVSSVVIRRSELSDAMSES